MTARVGVGALLGLMLAACASTHATGVESPAAPELVAAPLPANEVDVSQVRAMRSSAASVPSGFACMVGRCTPCDDAMHTLTSPSSAVHSVAAGTRLAPVSP